MNDQNFDKMDQEMMKSMKPLRDKQISEGMLKGFSASVERRLEAQKQPAAPRRAFAPVWVPVMAVMILASVIVLRLPVSTMSVTPAAPVVEFAQLPNGDSDADMDIDAEISALKELGVWNDEDDSLFGADDVTAEELELSSEINTLSIA